MSKHTPGPWGLSGQLIVGPPEGFPNPKAEPQGKVIASLAWDYDGDYGATERRTKWSEAEANGLIMSTAPELLEALKALAMTFVDGTHYKTQNPYTRPQVEAALKTIAKATGFTDRWMDVL